MIPVDVFESVLHVEIRPCGYSFPQVFSSTLRFENSTPESLEFTAGFNIEETSKVTAASSRVNIRSISNQRGILIREWENSTTKLLEIQGPTSAWIVSAEE